MDLDMLKDIADVTGGTPFRADDRAQLENIYRKIDALIPIEIETHSYRPTQPLYHWPLGVAVLLVVLYHILMGCSQAFRALRVRHG